MSFVDYLSQVIIIPETKDYMCIQNLAGIPAEKITEASDGLRLCLAEYKQLGIRFAK
ncbi:fructose-bisphosphate aldolase class I [Spirosoma aureum]|uniref:Fructose-bisphosphate aldolase class I n=1 Tax=Spirosoma aureum TaxID=2692134 RepID=A0A6G9B048_9BACT|nr:fructose-bisphosphate aldolase class I [Spirosoma aureum]